jgi:hypothetical protein
MLLQTEQFTVLWILFALIVLGNSAVLVALLVGKRRKSRMNFFIMQLALAGQTTYKYPQRYHCDNPQRYHCDTARVVRLSFHRKSML